MPHYTVELLEDTYDGTVEAKLIAALTDAVADVFGETFRPLVAVDLFGVPRGRRAVGGVPVERDAPMVTLRLREPAFSSPAVADGTYPLLRAITDAVVGVLGEEIRARVNVLLVGVPNGRTGVGGQVA